jgi:hypothetical protein
MSADNASIGCESPLRVLDKLELDEGERLVFGNLVSDLGVIAAIDIKNSMECLLDLQICEILVDAVEPGK